MSDFAPAFERTMQFEDAPNHPGKVTHDAGGRTRFGIAGRFHPALPEEFWTGPADEARAQAEEIELEQYWKPLNLDGIDDQAIASKIFDMAVNMGASQAAVLAQRAVNFLLAIGGAQAPFTGGAQPPPAEAGLVPAVTHLTEDGVIGPKTLEQVNRFDPEQVLKTLRAFSEGHYRHIAAVNPAQAVNLDGWLRRAAA